MTRQLTGRANFQSPRNHSTPAERGVCVRENVSVMGDRCKAGGLSWADTDTRVLTLHSLGTEGIAQSGLFLSKAEPAA